MSALSKIVRAGVGRRRVQTAVTGLAAMMAVTASVLGGSLLVASDAPFDHAFARQHGAHLAVAYDGARVTAGQLSASARATGVTATAGPFATTTVNPSGGPGLDLPGGMTMSPMTLVGRADAQGAVDDLSLTSGHWLTGPGQLVVSADYSGPQLSVGQRVDFPDGRGGSRELTVVGVARSVGDTADGWVEPDQLGAVAAHGTGFQVLYRFASATTAAQLAADRAAVTDGLPAGAASGARTWLDVRNAQASSTGLFLPFLTAFGLLGLAMSVLIVGNVVAGAVGSGTRRIGVLKAVGFTPAQVVRAYLAQALLPAAVGTLLGVVVGDLIAAQILSATEEIYGISTLAVAPSVDLGVAGGTLVLVALTALVTALRAGRLRTVDALAVGRTSGSGRGRRSARVARALPLPRAVTLGLARPFARPVRALSLVAAVLFGAIAVTFAYGLGSSLQRIQDSKSIGADVTVLTSTPPQAAPPGGSTRHASADPAAVAAVIQAQPGTRSFFGSAHTQVTAAGTTGTVDVTAYVGDASRSGQQMVSGRWFHGAGEAVAPTPFLTATGAKIGDTVVLHDHGRSVSVRITGEVFVSQNRGMALFTDARTLAAAEPDLRPDVYYVTLTAGTDRRRYVDALNGVLGSTGALAQIGDGGGASQLLIMLDALTGLLTLMLVAVAGLGVLGTVVLETRERVHDLGISKAIGMTPRQTVAMVLSSVALVGTVGGAIGVPLGIALQRVVVPAMGHSAGLRLPASFLDVYSPAALAALALGGLAIALLGATFPATWAARLRTSAALRSE